MRHCLINQSGYDAGSLPTMELQNVKRLAIFKMRNIGDVLMITPLLRALRETFPEARITAVVNSGTEAMLDGNPHIDEVLVFKRESKEQNLLRQLAHEFAFVRELRRRQFDLTMSFTSGDRPAWYSLICGASFRMGYPHHSWGKYDPRRFAYNVELPEPPTNLHEVEKHFWTLEQTGVKFRNTVPGDLCLTLPEKTLAWARTQLKPLRPARIVHVHPVARWMRKCWNDDSMARVIDWLQLERGVRVVVTTGPIPRERARAQGIVGRCKTKPFFIDGTCTLGQLGAISAESDCFFGVDTAPMHIAAAVGRPVIALFGPTGVTDWHPWRTQGRTLHHPCPCREQGESRCDSDPNVPRLCMEAITVEEVQAALDEILKPLS